MHEDPEAAVLQLLPCEVGQGPVEEQGTGKHHCAPSGLGCRGFGGFRQSARHGEQKRQQEVAGRDAVHPVRFLQIAECSAPVDNGESVVIPQGECEPGGEPLCIVPVSSAEDRRIRPDKRLSVVGQRGTFRAGEQGMFFMTPGGEILLFDREKLEMTRINQLKPFSDDLPNQLFFHL